MRRRLQVGVCLVVLGLGTTPAWAQTERGFVRGLGGVTFGTAETASILGGGAGINVGKNVQIIGEFGRMQDVLPKDLRDQLDLLALLISAEVGLPVSLDVHAPAFFGLGGVRFNVPTAGRARPFMEASLGLANISFNVDAAVAGIDISDEVESEADLSSQTEFLIGLGGGVGIALTDAFALDFGYRYGRIFTEDPAVNTNSVYGALRINIR